MGWLRQCGAVLLTPLVVAGCNLDFSHDACTSALCLGGGDGGSGDATTGGDSTADSNEDLRQMGDTARPRDLETAADIGALDVENDAPDGAPADVPVVDVENDAADGADVGCAHFDCRWSRRMEITFSNPADQDLVDVPVLVELDSSNFDFGAAGPNGEDIRFIAADLATQLDHEIEHWGPDRAIIWVKVPQIGALSTADHIWLYFGASDTGGSYIPDPTAVWSNGYLAVYHFNGTVSDSTAFGHHPGQPARDRYTTGRIGEGWRHNGLAGSALVVDATSEFDALDDGYTVSAWFERETTEIGWRLLISRQHELTNGESIGLGYNNDTFHSILHTATESVTEPLAMLAPIGTPAHYAITWTGTRLTGYLDGAALSPRQAIAGTVTPGTNPLIIGGNINGTEPIDEVPTGVIDEVRVSVDARSAGWLEAQHAIMTGTFTSLGPVELLAP